MHLVNLRNTGENSDRRRNCENVASPGGPVTFASATDAPKTAAIPAKSLESGLNFRS